VLRIAKATTRQHHRVNCKSLAKNTGINLPFTYSPARYGGPVLVLTHVAIPVSFAAHFFGYRSLHEQ
jgi:hypothetical protein